jgi:hypothetical protein
MQSALAVLDPGVAVVLLSFALAVILTLIERV